MSKASIARKKLQRILVNNALATILRHLNQPLALRKATPEPCALLLMTKPLAQMLFSP
jgi:hypothetical protein